MFAQLAPQMGQYLVTILELDAKVPGRQHFDDAALKFNMFFSTHARADLTRQRLS
jgi:hypothetical protein